MKKTKKQYKGTDRTHTILRNRENVQRNADGMLISINREISSDATASDFGVWHRDGQPGRQYINFPSGVIRIREQEYRNSAGRALTKWVAYRNGEVIKEMVDGKEISLSAETASILKEHIEKNYRG